jgi:hypothetical protein
MNKVNQMKRKWLAIGIILLFVGIAIAPVINANDDVIASKTFSIPKEEKMISITVLEYNPDGTIEKSVVKLSMIQAEKLRQELNNVQDLDIRLSIYKKYNLIPQDVTAEKLRLGMEEKAQNLGYTNEKLKDLETHFKKENSDRLKFIYANFKSKVFGFCFIGVRFLVGTSFLLYNINSLIWWFFFDTIPFLQGNDIVQIYFSLIGESYKWNGTLPDSDFYAYLLTTYLIGFVGYVFGHIPIPSLFFTPSCEYYGYSIASVSLGIPTSDYPPWLQKGSIFV